MLIYIVKSDLIIKSSEKLKFINYFYTSEILVKLDQDITIRFICQILQKLELI